MAACAEAIIDQSSIRKDSQSSYKSKNFLNARLKTVNESIDLILLGRLSHCWMHEKANVEGQFDRLFEIWNLKHSVGYNGSAYQRQKQFVTVSIETRGHVLF